MADGESQTKDRLFATLDNVRKLHEKDVQNVLREAKAYHKAAQAFQQQGYRFAIELAKLGEKKDHPWGKGMGKVADMYKEIASIQEFLNKFMLEDLVSQLNNKVNEETKTFLNLEKRMKTVSNNYDANIQKLALVTQNSRKKEPQVMLKAMQDLTQAVADSDQKREGMISDLTELEHHRFASWFKILCTYMKTEIDLHDKISEKMTGLKPFWTQLDNNPPPNNPLSAWTNDEPGGPKSAQIHVVEKSTTPPAVTKETKNQNQREKSKPPKEGNSTFRIFGKRENKNEAVVPETPDTPPPPPPGELNKPRPPIGSNKSQANLRVIAKCRALHDYNAERDDELSLKAGDEIDVLKKQADDWWIGLLNGKRGVFPSTFVQEIPSESENVEQTRDPSTVVLPPGWEMISTETGEVYYYNATTGVTQWDEPQN